MRRSLGRRKGITRASERQRPASETAGEEATWRLMNRRGLQQRIKEGSGALPAVAVARLAVPVAGGRKGSKRSVVAAGARRTMATGWALEGDPPRHRQRGPEGSKRSVVAAASAVTIMVEEMDQDGSSVGGLSGRVCPAGWAAKTGNGGAEGPLAEARARSL